MFVTRIVSVAILQLSILFTLSYGVDPDDNPFPHWSNDPAARFQVTFINTKPTIVNAFSQVLETAYFPEGIKVESELADFEKLQKPYDCVVSPANSIGHGDGGFDAVLWSYFGRDFFPVKVQKMIVEKYGGEQPIGTSEIVQTGHPQIPYVAHAPTMYLPEIINNPRIVYNVMWAIMLSVYNHNRKVLQNPNSGHTFIGSVLCTTLGTGVGGVDPEKAATQHITALTNFYNRYDIFEYTVVQRKRSKVRMNPKEDLFLLKWSWAFQRFEVFTKEASEGLQTRQEELGRMS